MSLCVQVAPERRICQMPYSCETKDGVEKEITYRT